GPGGSRSATMGGSAFSRASDKIVEKAAAIAAHHLKLDQSDIKFADGVFSSPKTNRTMTIKEVAADAQMPARIPADMEPGLAATAVHKTPVNNYPNGCHVCE